MKTITYTNNQGLDLYFSNGITTTCYTQEELQDFLQRNNFQKC